MRKLQHRQQEDSTDQASRRGSTSSSRMGFVPEDATSTPLMTTRPDFSLEINNSTVFKSPTPMRSESTCKTSSLSPTFRKIDSSEAGIDARDESESPAAPTRKGVYRRDYNTADEGMFSGEAKESSAPSDPSPSSGGTRRQRRGDDEPWTWFDSPPRTETGVQLKRRPAKFKIFVVFRGGWCDTSRTLLKGFADLNQIVKRAGGKLVAVSSQTPELVAKAVKDHKLTFSAHGDPTNKFVKSMNRRFNLDCQISTNDIVIGGYPHGMAQPCVVAIMMDEFPDESSVLYKWERWQTIGTLKHESVMSQILKEVGKRTCQQVPPPTQVRTDVGSRSRPTSPAPITNRPYGRAPRLPPSQPRRHLVPVDPLMEPRIRPVYSEIQPETKLETPRERRSLSLASSQPPSPSPSVGLDYRGYGRSIDEAVDSALRIGPRYKPRSSQRTPRGGNSFRWEQQGELSRPSEAGVGSERVSSAASSRRKFQTPEDSSGRNIMVVRAGTQNHAGQSAAAPFPPPRWGGLGLDFPRDEDGESEAGDGRPPLPHGAHPDLGELGAITGADADGGGGGIDRDERASSKPPAPSSHMRWMGRVRESFGNGGARRPPSTQAASRNQQAGNNRRRSWGSRNPKPAASGAMSAV